MACRAGRLPAAGRATAGSRPATLVNDQARPSQCATLLPPNAQTLAADSALPPSRPPAAGLAAQALPSKCQSLTCGPKAPGSPKAHTSAGPRTTAPPTDSGNECATDHAVPFQCSACDRAPVVNAQTSAAEVAPAATTASPETAANGTRCQVPPLRRKATGA